MFELFLHQERSEKVNIMSIWGRSENDPKGIGIGPESLISQLRIIETPQKPKKYIDKPRKNKNTLNLFACICSAKPCI